MSSNRIAYSNTGAPLKQEPQYRLAKGRSAKPDAVGTCDLCEERDRMARGVRNTFVLATMKPVARVQSRHRVSPSPRKIPKYKQEEVFQGKLAEYFQLAISGMKNR